MRGHLLNDCWPSGTEGKTLLLDPIQTGQATAYTVPKDHELKTNYRLV